MKAGARYSAAFSPLIIIGIDMSPLAQYTIGYTLKTVHSNQITLSTRTTALSAALHPHQ